MKEFVFWVNLISNLNDNPRIRTSPLYFPCQLDFKYLQQSLLPFITTGTGHPNVLNNEIKENSIMK